MQLATCCHQLPGSILRFGVWVCTWRLLESRRAALARVCNAGCPGREPGGSEADSFLPLHPEVLADNPGANVVLLSSTTMFALGGLGLGLGMPC